MKINDTIKTISESLAFLSLEEMAARLEVDVETCRCNTKMEDLIAASFSSYAGEVKELRAAKYFKASRLGNETYFSDYEPVAGRNLSEVELNELEGLHFLKERRPLVIQGTSGVGKTWVAKATATKACLECNRVYWIEFPALMADLRSRKIRDSKDGTKKYTSRIKFFSGLNLLCIDEFLNEPLSESDVLMLQDLFNALDSKRRSFLIATQCDLTKLPQMVGNESIGSSIRGRILGRAKVVNIIGPDIRLLDPDLKPKGAK